MSKQKTERPRYMVSVYESVHQPGTFTFTFVPKGIQQEGGEGGWPRPVPQYIVDVHEQGDQLTFDWRGWAVDAPGTTLGHVVNMSGPEAEAYILRGVSHEVSAGSWRWAYQRPELQFALGATENLKFVMDFSLPSVTFEKTGPVTISVFINKNLLDKLHIDTPGQKRFEKPVPSPWLRIDEVTSVVAEIDKPFVTSDGTKLGFIIRRAGFIE